MFEIQIQIGLTKPTVRVIDRLSDAILTFAGKKAAADDFDIVKDENDSAAIPATPEPEPVKTESKEEPGPEPTKGEVPPEEPGVDYDKIREEIVSIIRSNIRIPAKKVVIKEKLKAYGVSKASDLENTQLETFLAEIKAIAA